MEEGVEQLLRVRSLEGPEKRQVFWTLPDHCTHELTVVVVSPRLLQDQVSKYSGMK